MIGLKNLTDHLDITVLNTELLTVHREWNYRNVNNPYSRIYYVTEGAGTIRHNDQTYPIRPGNLYLIPCYTTVDMTCEDHFTHYYVHFTSRLQTGLDILSMFECGCQVLTASRCGHTTLFDRLLELNPGRELIEYDAKKPIYQQVLNRAVDLDREKTLSDILETNAIIRQLLSVFFQDYSSSQFEKTLCGLKRFETVLEYIQQHLDKPIAVGQLAKIANLNPTYFSNLFSKLMGGPPLHYINKRRIEKAQELLMGTHETLYTIARQVGFTDEYYFSRIFKKNVGISPDYYRKQPHIPADRKVR